jgi:hypothetical protein
VPGNGPLEAGYDALKHVAEAFQSNIPDHTLGLSEDTTAGAADNPGPPDTDVAAASSVRISEATAPDTHPQVTADSEKLEISNISDSKREVAATDLKRPTKRHGGAAPA